MARLYANENFPVEVVERPRALGHDVLTTHDADRSNQGTEDHAVLRFAIETHRCVLTIHRHDFQRLHRMMPTPPGIVVGTENREDAAFAGRIGAAIREAGTLTDRLIKIVRRIPS